MGLSSLIRYKSYKFLWKCITAYKSGFKTAFQTVNISPIPKMKSFLIVALAIVAVSAVPTLRNPRILDNRIIGGEEIRIEQAPHQISLRYYGSHICGGSIIAPNLVVTAAHCTDGSSASALSVRAGSASRLNGGVILQVVKINQNPLYNGFLIDFDISVVELESNFVYSSLIQPVALPELDQGFAHGASSFVTGWGSTSEGGSLPEILRGVQVEVVGEPDCKSAYGASSITRNMLCAGVNGGGKDACQGDSGGPLIANGVLAGLTSWGYGCARPNYPGVYSHVGALRYYIHEISGF